MAHTGLLDCVVVGAGPAGLAASKFLHKHELNYICLEAHTVAGGRARGQQGFNEDDQSDLLQLGADFIHGQDNQFYRYAMANHVDVYPFNYPDHLWDGTTLEKHAEAGSEPWLAAKAAIASLSDEQPSSDQPDLTVREHWANLSTEAQDAASHLFANDRCTDIDNAGLQESRLVEQQWQHGNEEFLPSLGWSEWLNLFGDGLHIQTCHAVTHVDRREDGIYYVKTQRTDRTDSPIEWRSRHVIITVPLPVLKQDTIIFNPPLSTQKQEAIQGIQVQGAAKVFVKFDKPVWKSDISTVTFAHGPVPEVWFLPQTAIAVLFVTGSHLTRLKEQEHPPNDKPLHCHAGAWNTLPTWAQYAVRYLATTFDVMFELEETCCESITTVTSVDWTDVPYIHGGYSSPSLHSYHKGWRAALAASVDHLHFAGEATHPSLDVTVQGAMETGTRAAAAVMGVLAAPPVEG